MSRVLSLAGFEVTLIGRFWVIPEASELAALLHMMNLQICRTPASLASPAVALEHLLEKHLIGVPVQAIPGLS
jgi:hypothetical protein